MQARYYERSPHNLVRIILGKAGETDTSSFNVYTRASEYLHDWRSGGLLRHDPEPAFYIYSQTFTLPGTRDIAERRGLSPWAASTIIPIAWSSAMSRRSPSRARTA